MVVVAGGGGPGAMSGPRANVAVLAQTPLCLGPAHPLSIETPLFYGSAHPLSVAAPTASATGLPVADVVVGAVAVAGAGAGDTGPGRAVGANGRERDLGLMLRTRGAEGVAVPICVSVGLAGDAVGLAVASVPENANTVIVSAGPDRTPTVRLPDLGLDGGGNFGLVLGLGLGLGQGIGSARMELQGHPAMVLSTPAGVSIERAPGAVSSHISSDLSLDSVIPHGDGSDGSSLAGRVLGLGDGDGDFATGETVGGAYRPFCETVFREMFSRKMGYAKSKRLSCLCSWCESFGEAMFNLLIALVKTLHGLGVASDVTVPEVKKGRDFLQLGGLASHLVFSGPCGRNPRHCPFFACSIVGGPFRHICPCAGPDNVHDVDDCSDCNQLERVEMKLRSAIANLDVDCVGRSRIRARFFSKLGSIFGPEGLARYRAHLIRDRIVARLQSIDYHPLSNHISVLNVSIMQ